MAKSYWTNPSVLSLAQDKDPVEVVTQKARSVILNYIESGGNGPPFDTMEIARFLGASVLPSAEVRDAKTSFVAGKPQIEFNPNRPKNRIRYSICHELVHTFFPDWKEETRYRASKQEMRADVWQLEMLCNIGASELLMPIGSFPELQDRNLSIEGLLQLSADYEVSIEALLLRFIKLTKIQTAIFSSSRVGDSERYRVDYAMSSATFPGTISNGLILSSASTVGHCTAIGFTSKGQEKWQHGMDDLNVECVGIPPYPYQTYPRVMGFVRPARHVHAELHRPVFVKGDATKPRGQNERILAFIVNDKTPRWGAGFALAVRRTWATVQESFISWVDKNPDRFKLGNVHITDIDSNLSAASLIAQHGYGESAKPRIRYRALSECLDKLATIAQERGASVHMPRIGSGEAKGHWPIIVEMISDSLSKRGVEVLIYDLPHSQLRKQPQGMFDFSRQSSN